MYAQQTCVNERGMKRTYETKNLIIIRYRRIEHIQRLSPNYEPVIVHDHVPVHFGRWRYLKETKRASQAYG